MATLEDVLFILEQDGLIDIRVRMAKLLLKELIEQQKETEQGEAKQ